MKKCFREPINELFVAAKCLQLAVDANNRGDIDAAKELFLIADMHSLYEWSESLWGSNSPYVSVIMRDESFPRLKKEERPLPRMPLAAVKKRIYERDGFHCRFCGVPVIPEEALTKIRKKYSDTIRWGNKNIEKHFAFQALYANLDHVIPNARGGESSFENMVVSCAPCNCARVNWTVSEVGLTDPRKNEIVKSNWLGLTEFKF